MKYFNVSKKIIFLILGYSILGACQQAAQVDKNTREQNSIIVKKLGELLIENYVFEDIAVKCDKYLTRKLSAGDYDNLSNKQDLAAKLTKDLQSVSKDKHMHVRISANNNKSTFLQSATGFGETKVLDGNIGYVKMFNFINTPDAQQAAIDAMKKIAGTKAVIFDMRENGGGSPESVRLICSYFFDKPTHLNSLYWRKGNVTQEFWTLEKVEGKKMPEIPVFIITSSFTFSGAEEFTYNFQTQKRGVVVGEVTGGGANPGGVFQLNNQMAIFIPTGRAINPVTGTNWEVVGVIPEIQVQASEALNAAIQKVKEIMNKK